MGNNGDTELWIPIDADNRLGVWIEYVVNQTGEDTWDVLQNGGVGLRILLNGGQTAELIVDFRLLRFNLLQPLQDQLRV